MAFVPPLFKKLGKTVTDLFKDPFETKKQLKLKSTTANGVTLESTLEAQKNGEYGGSAKSTFKQADIGTIEAELATSGSTKYSVKAEHLSDGLTVKLSGDEKPAGKVEVDYAREYFSLSSTVDVSKDSAVIEEAGVLGYDQLAVGGAIKFNVNTSKIVDFNVGAEYSQPDYTVTVRTSDQASKLGTSYLHKFKETTLASIFSYDVDKGHRALGVLGQFNLGSKHENITTKVNTDGTLGLAFEHGLPQYHAKLRISTDHNLKSAAAAPVYGFTLSVGDF
jgi:hypothetical protein